MTERITELEYWLRMAESATLRSTCDRLQVGAVLVRDGQLVSTGYNGAPRGTPHCSHDSHQPCTESVHAEANALLFAGRPLSKDSTMYVTHSPCYPCAGMIINAEVARVMFRKVYRDQSGLKRLRDAGVAVFGGADLVV